MDPDSWQVIIALLSSALCADFALHTGVDLEASSREELSETDLGISSETFTSAVLTTAFAAVASVFFYRFVRSLFVPVVSALLTALFILVLTAFFLVLPLFCGLAKSESIDGKQKFAHLVSKVLSPIAAVMWLPAKVIVRRLAGDSWSTDVTEEDVLELVDTAEEDVIPSDQKEMISNIFELDDADCGDMAVHRTEITAVSTTDTVDTIINAALETGFSRLPVYKGTVDNIVGVYHVKDLLSLVRDPDSIKSLDEMLRPVLFVPESYKATQLLRDFRQKRNHFAVVVDEYGGTAGIITMEDILESIVGDIEDEYDDEEVLINPQADGSLLCDGMAAIDDVFDTLGLERPDDDEEDEFVTVAGVVTDLLGYIPKSEDDAVCSYGGIQFKVVAADERRITSILACREQTPAEEEE